MWSINIVQVHINVRVPVQNLVLRCWTSVVSFMYHVLMNKKKWTSRCWASDGTILVHADFAMLHEPAELNQWRHVWLLCSFLFRVFFSFPSEPGPDGDCIHPSPSNQKHGPHGSFCETQTSRLWWLSEKSGLNILCQFVSWIQNMYFLCIRKGEGTENVFLH